MYVNVSIFSLSDYLCLKLHPRSQCVFFSTVGVLWTRNLLLKFYHITQCKNTWPKHCCVRRVIWYERLYIPMQISNCDRHPFLQHFSNVLAIVIFFYRLLSLLKKTERLVIVNKSIVHLFTVNLISLYLHFHTVWNIASWYAA